MWHIGRAARPHPQMSTAADDDDFELPQRRRTRVQTHDGDDANAEDEAPLEAAVAATVTIHRSCVAGSAAQPHPQMSTAADDDDFEHLPQRRRTRVQTHDGDDADTEDEAPLEADAAATVTIHQSCAAVAVLAGVLGLVSAAALLHLRYDSPSVAAPLRPPLPAPAPFSLPPPPPPPPQPPQPPPPPPPPPPPQPPPPPPPAVTAEEVAQTLNARFHAGGPRGASIGLASAGVLVSQFDELSDKDRPWEHTADNRYSAFSDRKSAMLLYSGMPEASDAWMSGAIPIFTKEAGGFVLRPSVFEGTGGLLCSYAYDSHTFGKKCAPKGLSETCVPGCQTDPPGKCNWCDADGCRQWGGCAHRPAELHTMLADHDTIQPHGLVEHGRGYNELVFNAARWNEQMPWTFEAIFYLATPRCAELPGCKARAEVVHRFFREDYGYPQDPRSHAPLLRFDPWDWEAPFAPAD